MKAVLLCAGVGSRMSIYDTPKCLLPIDGKAIMHHWIDRLRAVGVEDIIISLHHKPREFIGYAQCEMLKGLTFSYEPDILGSAGTIYQNRRLLGKESFLIVYCDVWTKMPLLDLIQEHATNKPLVTIAVDKRDNLSACGVALVVNGDVIEFEEKSKDPAGRHAFSGIAVASPEALNTLNKDMKDIGKDWLPALSGQMVLNAFIVEDEVIDIGTPVDYERARA